VTLNIDQVAVASFALYDPTRSLTVTVRGASGNVIALDAARNGLIEVDDPATLSIWVTAFKTRDLALACHPCRDEQNSCSWHRVCSHGSPFGRAVLKAQVNPLLPRPASP